MADSGMQVLQKRKRIRGAAPVQRGTYRAAFSRNSHSNRSTESPGVTSTNRFGAPQLSTLMITDLPDPMERSAMSRPVAAASLGSPTLLASAEFVRSEQEDLLSSDSGAMRYETSVTIVSRFLHADRANGGSNEIAGGRTVRRVSGTSGSP